MFSPGDRVIVNGIIDQELDRWQRSGVVVAFVPAGELPPSKVEAALLPYAENAQEIGYYRNRLKSDTVLVVLSEQAFSFMLRFYVTRKIMRRMRVKDLRKAE